MIRGRCRSAAAAGRRSGPTRFRCSSAAGPREIRRSHQDTIEISENSTWALKRRYGMVDPRIEKLAKVLVHYSLQIRRNDLFRITGPSMATPLVRAVYAEAQAAGANLYVRAHHAGLG